jgi:hypothetical protein
MVEAKGSGQVARSLREIRPDVAAAVEKVLLRGLAPDGAARYAG